MVLAEIFEREIDSICPLSKARDAQDVIEANQAIVELYQSLGRTVPAIVWCESLYQFATLPSLLIGIMHSDMWQLVSADLENCQTDEEWKKYWDEAWENLWTNGGCQLLTGMNHTSRVGQQYGHLASTLMNQCKQQMMTWLRSGKLKRFEDKLNRELYRRYWALHLWQKTFAPRRMHQLNGEMEDHLEADARRNEMEWHQFTPFLPLLINKYESSLRSINSLINMMGAEPVAQLRDAIWFPFSIPYPVACEIWRKNVDKVALRSYQDEISVCMRLNKTILAVLCLEHVAFVCAKPTQFAVDEWGRLHSDFGPALTFADGFAIYAWHGVSVERRLIEQPETITIEEIEETTNIEIRRVLLERFGQSRYLQESGATIIHEDDFGTLFRKRIEGDEPLVMVKVVNSTPEPDGTYKDYFLRVPPFMRTAREAVAWTFGYEEEDYVPRIET